MLEYALSSFRSLCSNTNTYSTPIFFNPRWSDDCSTAEIECTSPVGQKSQSKSLFAGIAPGPIRFEGPPKLQEQDTYTLHDTGLPTTGSRNCLHWLHSKESSVIRKITTCSIVITQNTEVKVRVQFKDQTLPASELLAFVAMDPRKLSPQEIIRVIHRNAQEVLGRGTTPVTTDQAIQSAFRAGHSIHVGWKDESFTLREMWTLGRTNVVFAFLWNRFVHAIQGGICALIRHSFILSVYLACT
jgi:hypothetical protein